MFGRCVEGKSGVLGIFSGFLGCGVPTPGRNFKARKKVVLYITIPKCAMVIKITNLLICQFVCGVSGLLIYSRHGLFALLHGPGCLGNLIQVVKFAACSLFSFSTCNCQSFARSGRIGAFACIYWHGARCVPGVRYLGATCLCSCIYVCNVRALCVHTVSCLLNLHCATAHFFF